MAIAGLIFATAVLSLLEIVICCKRKFKLKLHVIKELNMLKDSKLTEASMPTSPSESPTKKTKGQQ